MAGATHGTMEVVIKNYDDIVKEFSLMESQAKKVVNRTVGDFKKRGPGWVSQEVCKEYNIKKKEVTAAKKGIKNSPGSIKVRGQRLDALAIEYRGRVLTPTHFAMKPKNRPARNKAYKVTAQIKKSGGRKALGSKVFLAPSGAEGTIQIPFQRRGRERKPIDVIKTVSIPQMITNEKVSGQIHERLSEELGKRFEHNLNQVMNSNK